MRVYWWLLRKIRGIADRELFRHTVKTHPRSPRKAEQRFVYYIDALGFGRKTSPTALQATELLIDVEMTVQELDSLDLNSEFGFAAFDHAFAFSDSLLFTSNDSARSVKVICAFLRELFLLRKWSINLPSRQEDKPDHKTIVHTYDEDLLVFEGGASQGEIWFHPSLVPDSNDPTYRGSTPNGNFCGPAVTESVKLAEQYKGIGMLFSQKFYDKIPPNLQLYLKKYAPVADSYELMWMIAEEWQNVGEHIELTFEILEKYKNNSSLGAKYQLLANVAVRSYVRAFSLYGSSNFDNIFFRRFENLEDTFITAGRLDSYGQGIKQLWDDELNELKLSGRYQRYVSEKTAGYIGRADLNY